MEFGGIERKMPLSEFGRCTASHLFTAASIVVGQEAAIQISIGVALRRKLITAVEHLGELLRQIRGMA